LWFSNFGFDVTGIGVFVDTALAVTRACKSSFMLQYKSNQFIPSSADLAAAVLLFLQQGIKN
jgi:hypothetical protein